MVKHLASGGFAKISENKINQCSNDTLSLSNCLYNCPDMFTSWCRPILMSLPP